MNTNTLNAHALNACTLAGLVPNETQLKRLTYAAAKAAERRNEYYLADAIRSDLTLYGNALYLALLETSRAAWCEYLAAYIDEYNERRAHSAAVAPVALTYSQLAFGRFIVSACRDTYNAENGSRYERERRAAGDNDYINACAWVPSREPEPAERAAYTDAIERAASHIDDDATRAAVVLYVRGEITAREAATVAGLSHVAIVKRAERVRANFRDEWNTRD